MFCGFELCPWAVLQGEPVEASTHAFLCANGSCGPSDPLLESVGAFFFYNFRRKWIGKRKHNAPLKIETNNLRAHNWGVNETSWKRRLLGDPKIELVEQSPKVSTILGYELHLNRAEKMGKGRTASWVSRDSGKSSEIDIFPIRKRRADNISIEFTHVWGSATGFFRSFYRLSMGTFVFP